MGFALLEKAHTKTVSTIILTQYRFGAVEHCGRLEAGTDERLFEIFFFKLQRYRRGRPYYFRACKSDHHHGLRTPHVGLQVLALVVPGAVVQVGKITEHFHTQTGNGIEVVIEGGPGEPAHGQRSEQGGTPAGENTAEVAAPRVYFALIVQTGNRGLAASTESGKDCDKQAGFLDLPGARGI